jgi:hypothetical protein
MNEPCPFCGDRDIRPRHIGHAGGWIIACHSCSCELGPFTSVTVAWAAWNRRPLRQPATPAPREQLRGGPEDYTANPASGTHEDRR